MGTYTYSDSKVIDQITFKKTANGSLRAYIHSSSDDIESIKTVLDTLKSNEFDLIPYTLGGKPCVEVRGFQRESKLISLLYKNKWITDNPVIQPDKEDVSSWVDKFKNRSLQAAGGLYAFGDASFIAYGMKDSSPLDVAAGVLYALPTPILLAYGRNDQSQLQIKDFAKMMAKEFKKEVQTLPDGCSLQTLTADHKKGVLQNTSDLLQRYPSEFMNLCYAGAGACILLAATKHLKGLSTHGVPEKTLEGWMGHLLKSKPDMTKAVASEMALKNIRTENYLNASVGATTVVSGLFGAFVKEKAHDPDELKKTGLDAAWNYAREHPLTIAAAGFMVSTLLHAGATWVATKGQDPKHKQAVPFRIAFVVSALMAELMVAISSKGHGEGVVSDKSVDESALAIAADLIVKQPKGLQNHLIEEMGKFLGRNDVLAVKDELAVDSLRKQVEALHNNPWVKAEELCRENTTETPIVITPAIEKSTVPAWQAKVATGEQNNANMQPQV